MEKFRAVAMRLVGPIDVTVPRVFILVVLAVVTFWVWRTNRRVSVFYCSDDIVAQGLPCNGVDEYVQLHIAFCLVALSVMGLLFVISIRVYVVGLVLFVFVVSSAIVFELWISAYSSDSIMHAREAWRTTIGGGLVANCVGAVGILGHLVLLLFDAKRLRRRR